MRKEKTKLSLFIYDKIYYTENPRKAKCNILKLRYFNKVSKLKVFIQALIFTFILNDQLDVIVKVIPFKRISKLKNTELDIM